MNERSAIDGILAVITGIVMAPSHIDWFLIRERIKTGFDVSKAGGSVAWVLLVIRRLLFKLMIDMLKGARAVGDLSRAHMAGIVSKPCIRRLVACPATLMVNAQRISAGKAARDCIINKK